MRQYLVGAILEQVSRGLSLKAMVSHPLKCVELQALAERCERILDENIEQLNYLCREIRNRKDNDLEDIYRGYRECTRQIELIEYFGISALHYETSEIGYLNKLMGKIHQEINLPLNPPAVACISTKYYFFHPFTNVIFVPIGEHNFLLHLPDLYHELGHQVLSNCKTQPRLNGVLQKYDECVKAIRVFYDGLLAQKKRETGPESLLFVIRHIYSQWKNYWAEEFFADLFALFTLGPAYAWSHLHLTCKKTDNVYDFSEVLPRDHPSDDARMRMLIIGMRLTGWKAESERIWSQWNKMLFTKLSRPENEYQYAYPGNLMETACRLFLEGIRNCGFNIADRTAVDAIDAGSMTRILNQAWDRFWSDPARFRFWEEALIANMKRTLTEDRKITLPRT